MLLATLFPLYAPWLNRNFAAIQPEHNHLYVGKAEQRHSHHLGDEQPPELESDVTNLPNLSVNGTTAVLMLVALWCFAAIAVLPSFYFFREQKLGFNLFIVTPPVKPPRLTNAIS